MFKKKKNMFAMIMVSLMLTFIIFASGILFPKPMLHGDYPYYEDVKSISNAADIIITGEVVSSKDVQNIMIVTTLDSANLEKEPTPYTISEVRVTEVVKGNLQVGDLITIKQLGDFKNYPEFNLAEMDGYLVNEQDNLMFLMEYQNTPYSAVNPTQGIIEIKDDGTLYSANKYALFGNSSARNSSLNTLDEALKEIRNSLN